MGAVELRLFSSKKALLSENKIAFIYIIIPLGCQLLLLTEAPYYVLVIQILIFLIQSPLPPE